jgi:hypothetical protein
MDLGSRNGTYVGDRRVVTPVTLENGAIIHISGTELHFDAFDEGDVGGDGIPDVTVATTSAGSNSSLQHVAILVCDIRGFSTASEKLEPDVLARVLGGWFAEAGNLVNQSGGTVDKFIGDAILSYWIEPEEADALGGACSAALQVAEKFLAWWRPNVRGRVWTAFPGGNRHALRPRELWEHRPDRPTRCNDHR